MRINLEVKKYANKNGWISVSNVFGIPESSEKEIDG
jgi:hypothetical protein